MRRITGNLCYENNKFIGPISLNENLNNLIRDVSYHETQKQKEFWESNEYKNPIFFYPFLNQVQLDFPITIISHIIPMMKKHIFLPYFPLNQKPNLFFGRFP